MRVPLRMAALALLSGVTLGGCAYGLGDPYGGYGGVNVGYGNGYYGNGYGSPYGYGGYGYGSPYGWYDNYYYPGSGYYVYDSYRRPHVWTSTQRSYWTARQPTVVTTSGTRTTRTVRPNWSGFNRSTASAKREARQTAHQTAREERQQAREDRRDRR